MNFAEKQLEEDLIQDYEVSYVKKAPKSLYLKDIDEKDCIVPFGRRSQHFSCAADVGGAGPKGRTAGGETCPCETLWIYQKLFRPRYKGEQGRYWRPLLLYPLGREPEQSR